MTLNRLAVPALSLFLGATGFCVARASGLSQGSPSSTYAQDRGGWDTPPQELQDVQRQGFRDGIEGARKDFDNHRRPDVNNRDEYRNPRLPSEQREAYRDGFRRGYERGVSHFVGVPQQPVGQYDQQLRAPYRSGQGMGQGSDIQRRGFQDGMDGAQKDFGNHRQWNVNNRDEYRNPNVPAGMQQEYRDAFSRGYQQFVSQQGGGLYTTQGQGSDIQRRGFQDGMDGARKDLDNHRRPNVNNRDEYRRPNVPRQLRNEYREAFKRGYDQAMSQLIGSRSYPR